MKEKERIGRRSASRLLIKFALIDGFAVDCKRSYISLFLPLPLSLSLFFSLFLSFYPSFSVILFFLLSLLFYHFKYDKYTNNIIDDSMLSFSLC